MILIALITCLVSDQTLVDDVDVIERNYRHRDVENYFQQWIFWNWDEDTGYYHVTAWRMVDDPWKLSKKGSVYQLRFIDRGYLRLVRAREYRVTRTLYDPEMDDRALFPESCRSDLSAPPAR